MDEKSMIDGVSLEDLLPPAPRVKRKEPNNVMDAQTKLKTGMAQAIAPSNRGFQMLMKMGYKPEQDHKEPLKIELRKGRGGLGLFEAQQEEEHHHAHEEQENELKRRKDAEKMASDFDKRQRMAAASRKLSGQLFSMLKLAHQLANSGSQASSSSRSPSDQSEQHHHNWNDPPPILRDDFVLAALSSIDCAPAPTSPNLQVSPLSELRHLLAGMTISNQEHHHAQLNLFLRDDFLYCFWCGRQYATREELQALCPGGRELDHLEATMSPSDPFNDDDHD